MLVTNFINIPNAAFTDHSKKTASPYNFQDAFFTDISFCCSTISSHQPFIVKPTYYHPVH